MHISKEGERNTRRIPTTEAKAKAVKPEGEADPRCQARRISKLAPGAVGARSGKFTGYTALAENRPRDNRAPGRLQSGSSSSGRGGRRDRYGHIELV